MYQRQVTVYTVPLPPPVIVSPENRYAFWLKTLREFSWGKQPMRQQRYRHKSNRMTSVGSVLPLAFDLPAIRLPPHCHPEAITASQEERQRAACSVSPGPGAYLEHTGTWEEILRGAPPSRVHGGCQVGEASSRRL